MMDVCRGGEILALIGKGCPYQKVGGEAGALRPSNSISRCSRERPDPRATSGAPTNPLELFLPQVRRGRPARQFLERVFNHHFSHCREIAPFRQARNPGKLQNTVHCNHCTVPAGSGSAAQVSFVALVGGDRELAHMHCSPYSPRLRRRPLETHFASRRLHTGQNIPSRILCARVVRALCKRRS